MGSGNKRLEENGWTSAVGVLDAVLRGLVAPETGASMLPMYRLLVGMASHPALPRAGGGSVCIALDLQALHLQVCLRSGHLLLLRPSVGDAAFMPLSAMQPS